MNIPSRSTNLRTALIFLCGTEYKTYSVYLNENTVNITVTTNQVFTDQNFLSDIKFDSAFWNVLALIIN